LSLCKKINFLKAFRPGLVDLTDEQAIASTGAITVVESFNQFDMLMPDPVFDLK
jgi:hypothetical protein